MKYRYAEWGVGVFMGAQGGPCTKLGGFPWGLRAEDWPRCDVCKGWTSHWGQFVDQDAGTDPVVVTVFYCATPECRGDRKLSRSRLLLAVTPQSALQTGTTPPPDAHAEVYAEARVVAWREDDDSVPPELAAELAVAPTRGEWSRWLRTGRIDEVAVERATMRFRLGGTEFVPRSVRRELPSSDWTLVAQFQESVKIHGPCPEPDDIGGHVRDRRSPDQRRVVRNFLWFHWTATLPYERGPSRGWRGPPWNPKGADVYENGVWTFGTIPTSDVVMLFRSSGAARSSVPEYRAWLVPPQPRSAAE